MGNTKLEKPNLSAYRYVQIMKIAMKLKLWNYFKFFFLKSLKLLWKEFHFLHSKVL